MVMVEIAPTGYFTEKFKQLKVSDVEHVTRGPKILYEMRLVIEVIIIKIKSNPLLNTR